MFHSIFISKVPSAQTLAEKVKAKMKLQLSQTGIKSNKHLKHSNFLIDGPHNLKHSVFCITIFVPHIKGFTSSPPDGKKHTYRVNRFSIT